MISIMHTVVAIIRQRHLNVMKMKDAKNVKGNIKASFREIAINFTIFNLEILSILSSPPFYS